jgi:hypothetical protein
VPISEKERKKESGKEKPKNKVSDHVYTIDKEEGQKGGKL